MAVGDFKLKGSESSAKCPVCQTQLDNLVNVGRHIYAKARIEESKTDNIERSHHDWVKTRFKKNARELKGKNLFDDMARLVES